jgi:hypothetical protein
VALALWIGLGTASLAADTTPAPEAAPVAPAAPDLLGAQLIAAKQYKLAYAHTMRQAFAGGDGPERLHQLNRAGHILWQGGMWEEAADHYRAIDAPALSQTGAAYSLYRLGQWENAISAGQGSQSPEAQYIVAAAYLQLEQPAAAYERLQAIPAGSSVSTDSQAIAQTMKTWGRLPQRSPALAGIMSAVLPGSGQTYAGAWPDGLAALLVNGGLIGAGWQLARQEQWFGLGLVGLFELGFYGGNIMSAVNNAKRFNRHAWSRRVDQTVGLRQPRLVPAGSGLAQESSD